MGPNDMGPAPSIPPNAVRARENSDCKALQRVRSEASSHVCSRRADRRKSPPIHWSELAGTLPKSLGGGCSIP